MNAYPRDMPDWLRRFLHDHPVLADLAVVVVALVAAWSSVFYVAELHGWGWALALATVPALALFGRRRAPFAALTVSLVAELAQWALEIPVNGAQIALALSLYAIARHQNARHGRVALGLGLALVVVAPLRQPYQGAGNTIGQVLFLIVVWVLGTNIALRQGYLQALEERAERLEHERDVAVRPATLTERTRLAREMHDVVAHHVSVMVVQAEGASWVMDTAPDQARSAVRTIAETGRSTLTELRQMLGVLREERTETVSPQPEFARLPELIEQFRLSGLEVAFSGVPDGAGAPEGVQLAVYRVVQESLTNVLKHVGAGTWAGVEVVAGATDIRVQVRDAGRGEVPEVVQAREREASAPALAGNTRTRTSGRSRGGQAALGGDQGEERSGSGHGLIGIRERAALFGGRTEFGPNPEGGFTVRAWFPVVAA
jgi:signal transduction histidine kinase